MNNLTFMSTIYFLNLRTRTTEENGYLGILLFNELNRSLEVAKNEEQLKSQEYVKPTITITGNEWSERNVTI